MQRQHDVPTALLDPVRDPRMDPRLDPAMDPGIRLDPPSDPASDPVLDAATSDPRGPAQLWVQAGLRPIRSAVRW